MSHTSLFPLRRDFLKYVGVASSLAVSGTLLGMQKRKLPEPPPPADSSNNSTQPSDAQMSQRAQLKLNEQEFRESLAHLYQRVSELKQSLETLHTAEVF